MNPSVIIMRWLRVRLTATIIAVGVVATGTPILGTAQSSAPQSDPPLRNQLASSKSPYLRSARMQPVAWQPWGPEALALAARLNRPIWLDIGAIWCHWCHVMDRESYENPEIAALINQYFVPVKVDRDERPDIDARYQAAHLVLNGIGGGWPLTMMLTPSGEPFLGATYIPPDTRGSQDGLRVIVPRIGNAYRTQPGTAVQMARDARARIAVSAGANPTPGGALKQDTVRAMTGEIAFVFDTEFGGFGVSRGSKFPNAEAIRLALAQAFLTRNDGLRRKALHTLDSYALSGMRDHVHGGFFRYSVNRELTVPHFEKMDYVQAALLEAYLDAFRLTGETRYAEVARDIMRYVDGTLSDRTLPGGSGFYAHQDADISLDDDGSYYTWSLAEAETVLPPDDLKLLAAYYDLQKKGEMESHPDRNVLRVAQTVPALARRFRLGGSEIRDRIGRGTTSLEAARRRQRAPFVERTAFTDRNAMMISAYLHAYETLQDTAARDFALKTLDFLLARALAPDGSLWHATAEGEGYIAGFLLDHALFADALLDAYQVTGSQRYLAAAQRITNRAIELCWDARDGGFFDRPHEERPLGLLTDRTKPYIDSPLPGGNAVAARVFDKLYLLTGLDRWRELAEKTFTSFGAAQKAGTSGGTYALALEAHLTKPPQVVVIGGAEDRQTKDLAAAARQTFRPGRMVTVYDPAATALTSLPEPVAEAAKIFASDRTPRAYVCVGETCAPPTTSPADVVALVRDYGRARPN